MPTFLKDSQTYWQRLNPTESYTLLLSLKPMGSELAPFVLGRLTIRIELKENIAAIICETFAHAVIDSGDRFNYHFESIVAGQIHTSESYDSFLSAEHAERDARREVDRYEIPQPAPTIKAPRKPENWHVHICYHGCSSLECVNPACWKDARRFETNQVECPECENIIGRYYYLGSYQPIVNNFIKVQQAQEPNNSKWAGRSSGPLKG